MYKFLIFFFVVGTAFSQSENKPDLIKQMNLQLSLPEGYQETDLSMNKFWCTEKNLPPPVEKTITNADKSLIIGITLNPSLPEAMRKIVLQQNPNYSDFTNFMAIVRDQIDIHDPKAMLYDPGYLKQNFNADAGFKFRRKCDRIAQEGYKNNKVVMMQKEGSGFFQVIFLYNEPMDQDIDEIIHNVLPNLVRFGNAQEG